MAKLTISDFTSLANESTFLTALNTAFTAVETAMENTLSRDGTTPNTMSQDFDMNSQDILNAGTINATALNIGGTPAAGFDWEGDWTTSTAYIVHDAVSNNGSMYVCKSAHTSSASTEPGTGASWATYWDLSVSKGDTGATGTAGEDGVTSGLRYTFDTDSTDSNPGEGIARTSRGATWTVGQTGFIYISDNDRNSTVQETVIQTFDDSDSSPKGGVVIQDESDNTNALYFAITGDITDVSGSPGYQKIPVLCINTIGTLTEVNIAVDNRYTGDAGSPGGMARWKWSTGTSGDPTSTYLGVNNATMGSVTELRIHDQDYDSVDQSTLLALLDDASNANGKSLLRIQKKRDPSVFLALNVTSNETDNTTWRSWTVSYVSHNGSFTADDEVWLIVSLSGNDGAGAVDSVFGRTGAVTASSGDYTASQVTNAFDTTGNDSDDITEGSTNLFLTSSERTKLTNTTGTNSGDEASASTTVAGVIEIATSAEINTGTDATRAISPDSLAGSNYGEAVVPMQPFLSGTDVATGDGAGNILFRVPSTINGWDLIRVAGYVDTAGTTGTTDIQIRNETQTADMLSTKLTIDSGEKDSSTAATAAVIDGTNDDVATGDIIKIDVDAVSTTAPQGLFVELTFRAP